MSTDEISFVIVILAAVLISLIGILIIIGFISNLIKITRFLRNGHPRSPILYIRVIGVVLFPIGVILGYV